MPLTAAQQKLKSEAEAVVARGIKNGATDYRAGRVTAETPSDITDDKEKILYLAGYSYGRYGTGSPFAGV